MPRVAPVRTPRLQAEPRVTLPLDINNYPMAKFVRCHFKVRAGSGPSSPANGHRSLELMLSTARAVPVRAQRVGYELPVRLLGQEQPGAHGGLEGRPQGLRKQLFASQSGKMSET